MSTIQTSSESPTSVHPVTSGTKRKRGGAGAGGSQSKAWVGANFEGHQHVVWCEEAERFCRALARAFQAGEDYRAVQIAKLLEPSYKR